MTQKVRAQEAIARVPWGRLAFGALGVALAANLAACGNSSAVSATRGTQDVSAARAAVSRYEARPTALPVSKPLGRPAPTGLHIDFVSCGTDACNQMGQIIKVAADKLGWHLNVLDTDGTPEQEKTAFQQVVREKSNAVLYLAVPRSVFASLIPQLEANGTYVAGAATTDPVGDGINYVIGGPSQIVGLSYALSSWIASDSGGDAHAVFVDVPELQITVDEGNAFDTGMKKYCPNCQSSRFGIPITSLGKDSATRIVAYLRAHPDVKYVATGSDSFLIGLPGALKAAGLSDVKIGGIGPTPTNLQYLATGQEQFSAAFPYYEVLWSMVDAVARHALGIPVPAATYPVWLLTKSNVPNTNQLFPVVKDVEEKFFSLWGLS